MFAIRPLSGPGQLFNWLPLFMQFTILVLRLAAAQMPEVRQVAEVILPSFEQSEIVTKCCVSVVAVEKPTIPAMWNAFAPPWSFPSAFSAMISPKLSTLSMITSEFSVNT